MCRGLIRAAEFVAVLLMGVTLVVAAVLCTSAELKAQEAGGPGQDAAAKESLFSLLRKGGPVMIPLGLCSVLAVAIAFERLISLRRRKIIPDRFIEGLKEHLTEGKVDIGLTLGTGETVVVGTVVEGDLMALSALIPPYHLSASGTAKEDGSLIQIEAVTLRKLLEENPELGYRLMQGVAKGIMTRLQDTRVELAGQSYAT